MWFDFNLHCPEGKRWGDELLPSSDGHLQSSRMLTQSRKHFVNNKSGVPGRKRLAGASEVFCFLISTCTVGLMPGVMFSEVSQVWKLRGGWKHWGVLSRQRGWVLEHPHIPQPNHSQGWAMWAPITSLHTRRHNCTSHTWKYGQYFQVFSKISCLLMTAFLVLFLCKDYLALFIYMLCY